MHFTGYWQRDAVTENTVYYDDAGNEVLFKPGKTYIQVLKDTKEVNAHPGIRIPGSRQRL